MISKPSLQHAHLRLVCLRYSPMNSIRRRKGCRNGLSRNARNYMIVNTAPVAQLDRAAVS